MPNPAPNPPSSFLFTDQYELTMAQAYDAEGMRETAVFELYFRRMPAQRRFVVAAGLDDVLSHFERTRFTEDDLSYLRTGGVFSERFLDRLRELRFTGDVDAVPEGTVVFANEPLVQVRAPIIEAQLAETLVLNQVHFQSVAATKAARVMIAAAGRTVVEFGARRAHGIDAAVKAARASYLVGAAGTSNVLAGKLFDIPIFGTMAHSYVQSHDDEAEAFARFAEQYPGTTLLVDTYDTLAGVQLVIDLARRQDERFSVGAIRLDSGDLGALAVSARRMLDDAGLGTVGIFASGGLDEHRVAALVAAGAPIDGFGVGTRMVVAEDAPTIDMAYKLVSYAGTPRVKLSPEKTFYPGRKQVFRSIEGGRLVEDVIGLHDEEGPGRPLLQPVMRDGRRLPAGQSTLQTARIHAMAELDRLPSELRRLDGEGGTQPVRVSESLLRAHCNARP